eukprot:TRINITY_DN15959_c0_g1_i1.p1 TRINITY_DN15959_c0_g1~~TRINITY_DN15959_c0_g1_i1.p1  ORF type:complete len:274 (+),score=5.28 TRINITY_DN15959_c0_g1_i1:181-1002(+)
MEAGTGAPYVGSAPPTNEKTNSTPSKPSDSSGSDGSGIFSQGNMLKAACVLGGAYLIRKIVTRARRDHCREVSNLLSGEKFSADQAARDPANFFNLRLDTCPATVLEDGSRVLYCEQAFWRTPEKPFRQRFCVVKPCAKEMQCDAEVATYALRDVEEYRNFCERPKNQRPQPEEVIGDISEHLTTVYLSRCEGGRKCAYEGSTPPGGFPNNWNGATRCTSELTLFRNGEVHSWDRGYTDDGVQVWGPKSGPYEYKPKNMVSNVYRPDVDQSKR